MKNFASFGIYLPASSSGKIYSQCPKCSSARRKKTAKCLGVDVERGTWTCFHCGWHGNLKFGEFTKPEPHKEKPVIKPRLEDLQLLTDKEIQWFRKRGISENTLKAEKIMRTKMWFPQVEEWRECIAFPYYKQNEIINIKYRDFEKNMRQVSNAEKNVYRYGHILERKEIIITEGEVDALSFVEIGLSNVCSVPNGAKDLSFLKSVESIFDNAEIIILATDDDNDGRELRDELARRIGKEKCFTLSYPDNCKDPNDILVKYGSSILFEVYQNKSEYPIEGVYGVEDIVKNIYHLYESGVQGGLKTGWPCLDQYYSVKTGQVTVITGIPGHGKSEFVDALVVNLAKNHNWKFGIFSPENYPLETHFEKIAEKFIRKPFARGYSQRINKEELDSAIGWVGEHIKFILPKIDLGLENILLLCRTCVYRYGVNAIILDPWNEIDHTRPVGLTETEYISQSMTKMRQFARINDVHFFIIAHPAKLQKDKDGKYPVPTPYDISGSAHWRNKSDNCLAIWRNLEKNDGEVTVHVQKIRYKHIGKIGNVNLYWDKVSGCFIDRNYQEFAEEADNNLKNSKEDQERIPF